MCQIVQKLADLKYLEPTLVLMRQQNPSVSVVSQRQDNGSCHFKLPPCPLSSVGTLHPNGFCMSKCRIVLLVTGILMVQLTNRLSPPPRERLGRR